MRFSTCVAATALILGARTAGAVSMHQVCVANRTALPSGIDVSDLNGVIDWNDVKKAGYTFAFIKSSQGAWGGSHSDDPQFAANWKGARDAGLLRSAYHFFDPTSDVTAQVNLFISLVGDFWEPGELPPMIDLECPTSSDPNYRSAFCDGVQLNGWVPSAQLTTEITDFLDAVEQRTGRRPIIYSYNYWFWDSGVDRTKLEGYPLDISWPTSGNCYDVPDVFSNALFWQDSTTATVSGVPKIVDTDRFVGTLAQLQALAAGSPAQLSGNRYISAVTWPDGHEEAFARLADNHVIQISRIDNAWHSSTEIGVSAACGARAIMGATAPTVLGVDANAVPLASSWDDVNDVWRPALSMPGIAASEIHPTTRADGSMELVAIAQSGALSTTSFNGTTAPSWASLDGLVAQGVNTLTDQAGETHAFAVDDNGAGHVAVTTQGKFGTWQSIGGALASAIAPVRLSSGWVVAARGLDGHAQIAISTTTGFSAWTELGGDMAGEPSIAAFGNGAIVVARSVDAHVLVARSTDATFVALPDISVAADPFVFADADGSIDVFVIDTSNALRVSSSTDGVTFGDWTAIAQGVDACAISNPPDAGSAQEDAGSSPPTTHPTGCACDAAPSRGHDGWLVIAGALLLGARRRRTS